jgi:hypothetical protein
MLNAFLSPANSAALAAASFTVTNGGASGDDYAASTATAGVVSVGGSITGNIESTQDVDWFRVTLTAGRSYQFDLEASATGQGTLADPFLQLRDSSGTSISFDFDGGTGNNARITFAPTVSGTYYLAASSSASSDLGTYRLSATDLGVGGATNPSPPAGTSAEMILRHGSDGHYAIYDLGSNAILAGYSLGQVGTEWQFAGLGNFNGNNATGMLLRNSSTGQFEVYDIVNNNITSAASLGTV